MGTAVKEEEDGGDWGWTVIGGHDSHSETFGYARVVHKLGGVERGGVHRVPLGPDRLCRAPVKSPVLLPLSPSSHTFPRSLFSLPFFFHHP